MAASVKVLTEEDTIDSLRIQREDLKVPRPPPEPAHLYQFMNPV